MEFKPFPKMARLNRDCVITEKIDGTNAQIYIDYKANVSPVNWGIPYVEINEFIILAGSRSRWIGEGDDNFGFGTWVSKNREELIKLGPGQHFGEWWGQGIQRRYGLNEKRFSLFNTGRWTEDPNETGKILVPSCVHVVPVLYSGLFDTFHVNRVLNDLKQSGSVAAPGFMKPEGVVCYHVAANMSFKATIEKDDEPKSKSK